MSVSAMATAYGDAGVTPVVTLNTGDVLREREIGTCWANLQYSSAGTEAANSTSGADNFSLSRGNWLDSGAAADVWLERTINSGTLWTDPGGGRLIMSTTRTFKVRDANSGFPLGTANIDVEMWDAASGGSLLDDVAGMVLTADYFNACPTCCFPPDTLVLMGNGESKEIGTIKAGERVATQLGSEEVGEVIVRERRPMYKLTFEDGRTLVLSVDHPIYIKGKGMACVKSESDYKGRGVAAVLEIGDYARTDGKVLIKLVGIDHYDFPGKVYTLSNSLFFAGGVLVY